jgi:hypothetical protein
MQDDHIYRSQAELCALAALTASTSDMRLQYLELAAAWQKLAEFSETMQSVMAAANEARVSDQPTHGVAHPDTHR